MVDDGRPLRVTVIGINFTPEPTGIAPYTSAMARGLAGRGHDIRVLTGYPHYPWWKVADGFTGRRTRERSPHLSVTRLRHYVPADPSLVRRSLMELHFGLRALVQPWGRPEVVVVVSPALIASRVVQLRARLTRVPVVTWVQDIYTLGLVQTGGDARKLRLVRNLERGLIRASRRIVAIHGRFQAFLTDLAGLDVEIDVIRNWSHVSPLEEFDREAVRRLHGWAEGDVVALHAGNMGAKQGLENVVAASRAAADRGSRVRFVLMGDGNQREALERLDPNASLQFLPPQPDGLFEQTLASSDVLLVNERPGLTEMSVPSKLTSYYTAGRPVVAAVDEASTSADEISMAGAGPVVDPSDPSALVDAVERLAADPERSAAHAESGRIFRERHLSEESALDSFERTLRRAAR